MNTTTPTTRTDRTPRNKTAAGGASARRGVALMLVVVAMGTAAVLTTAYMLSRDNSPAIGLNAQNTSASEWAARSGADMALAVLQTQANWVDSAPEKLLEGFTIAGGTVSVALTDLEGDPPSGEERELAMTVVADVGGVKTVVQRLVTMAPDLEFHEAVDPELGEFGVYAGKALAVESASTVGPWPESPRALAGATNNIGAGFTESSGLVMDGTATIAATRLYVQPDANSTLQDLTSNPAFVGGETLQAKVPAIPPRVPDVFRSLIPWPSDDYYGGGGGEDEGGHYYEMGDTLVIVNPGDSMTLVGGSHSNVYLDNPGVTLTLDGTVNGGDFHFDKIHLDHGAELVIKGHVRIQALDIVELRHGATIRLANEESSLRLFTMKNLLVDNAGIGVEADIAQDQDRDVTTLGYRDPSKIRIYAVSEEDGGDNNPRYHIKGGAIVCAAIHAPSADVEIQGAALCGRATVGTMRIRDGARFLYDPAFNNGAGFTNKNGPLYTSGGQLIDGLAEALGTYSGSTGLEGLAAHLEASVTVTEDLPSVGLGDPTPRDAKRAMEKPWPFIAKAIETGGYSAGNTADQQGNLYIPLDPDVFDLDKFFKDGVIIAVYETTGSQDLGGTAGNVVNQALGGVQNLGGQLLN